jgi:hypothetical protein
MVIALVMLKVKLIETMRSLQHACAAAVMRDDNDDAGDIATPETYADYDMWNLSLNALPRQKNRRHCPLT